VLFKRFLVAPLRVITAAIILFLCLKRGIKLASLTFARTRTNRITGMLLAAVALGSLLYGNYPALGQGTNYYKVDLAEALTKAPLQEWSRRRDSAQQVQPDFAVETLDDFIKMNEYYDKFLSDGVTLHRFKTALGDEIHCIDVATQQSVLSAGLDRVSIPRRPIAPPNEQLTGQPLSQSVGVRQGLDSTFDDLGRERACPEGTFPKLIFPKENLYRFKRFEDIFRKHPSGTSSSPIPPAATTGHEYALVLNSYLDNKGLSADFNVWSPTVQVSSEFSLAQLWVGRGSYSDNSLQTAETGWQVYPAFYGDNRARLFIYSTSDAYSQEQLGNSNILTGCYNLFCGRFVQTDNSVVIGSGFNNYSTTGGAQYIVTLAFIRDDGGSHNWWLMVGNTWVGYYPNSLFNSAGIADKNSQLEFGGELVNSQTGGIDTQTDMGSGAFPSAGFQYAAFIKRVRYVDMSYTYQNAGGLSAGLFPYTTKPNLWDIGSVFSSIDTNWLTYFYFGGPGNTGTNCNSTSISPTGVSPGAGIWNASVQVTAPTGCGWTAMSNNSWITITANSSGSGNGTVFYSVAANTGAARTGTATIAGQTFTVNQAAGCTYSIAPTSTSISADVSNASVQVTAPTGCGWTATSNNSWISITANSSGSGNGTVFYSVAANTGAARTGTATIAGQTFTVNQAAGCTYSIAPTSTSISADVSNASVQVTAPTGCGWTATSNNSWIIITANSSGSGNGTVFYSVAANTGAARIGTATIAGQTFTVSQAAITFTLPPTCSLSANPSTINLEQKSTLSWTSANATGGTISPGVGSVGSSGQTTVMPSQKTTYTGTFTGPGGVAACSTTVTVNSGSGGGPSIASNKRRRRI
jgi:hypothetical protein